MEFIIKYSSTKMAPNGKIPASSKEGIGRRYVSGGGICLGIWFVLTGASRAGALNPNQLPAKDKGTEITNQMPMSANIVVNGTAPEDCLKTKKRLRKKKVLKTMPGTRTGV
jgi:hypothetical protein